MPPDMESNEAEVSHESENEYDETDTQFRDEDGDDTMADSNHATDGAEGNGNVKKKYDPKDPMRPRRKKARRACYACQRAHLTCGDERPCLRCIKRGLAEQCQDGVRKKAKYLHDAPPEALGPVLGPGYNSHVIGQARPDARRHLSSTSDASSAVGTFYPQPNSTQYPVYSSPGTAMPSMPDGLSFSSQQSPVSPSFQSHAGAATIAGNMAAPQGVAGMANVTSSFFDPSNPAFYNFDLEGLDFRTDFRSDYAALEFGMLNQISGATANTPPQDQSIAAQGGGEVNFGAAPGVFNNGAGMYEAGVMGDYLALDRNMSGPYSQGNLQHGLPHAYVIAARPTSLQSPSTDNNSPQATGTGTGFESSPTATAFSATPGPNNQPQPTPPQLHRPKPTKPSAATKLGTKSVLGKRQRDPSYIYESVKEAYPYVRSFHKLISLIQSRFPSAKTVSIAKSLASIRPSFISCTGTLSQADFVFMEKTFQRALYEHEEHIHRCATPAVVCRRTGEVAAVNKEFTDLTGWSKDVLLGLKPNLNVNTGISGNASNSGRGTGQTTPRLKTLNETAPSATTGGDKTSTAPAADDRPQPVFLAELLDDDSVLRFYEDFAQLAFNNSRGTVIRRGRLLKYRTQEGVEAAASALGCGGASEGSPLKVVTKQGVLSNRVAKIDGEHGITKIEKDGKLECTYTWSIKRDTFDIPMMIILNFLPCFSHTHEQLAV